MNPNSNSSTTKTTPQEELTDLFSQTISALSADVTALKQIVCLQEAAKKNGNYMDAFLDLQGSVDSVQKEVRALQGLAAQERTALLTLEDLYNQTVAQNKLYKTMLRDKQQQQQQHVQPVQPVQHQSKPTMHMLSPPREQQDKENIVESLRRLNLESHMLSTPAKTHNERRDTVDLRRTPRTPLTPAVSRGHDVEQPIIQLHPISQQELMGVSRTIRGRLTLAVVNDALCDIVSVARDKYSVLHGNHNRQHYRKYWTLHKALEVEEHGTEPWVSEQELRSKCAFFRSGESTARCILAILRTLRRLKQVPARNSQVTYMIMHIMCSTS